ncbi:hypothetical protein [Ruania albidiflava]|uniref:hypothetical protein n=2 Tax=Ruania albidiflava TaxID=366586 RepID=UPI0003B530AB|nr:hypothetical protein [Ruania albidiflava]
MMRLRPGYEVYWRGPGSTQIGVDPRCAVVLDDLSDAEQQLLAELPQMMDVDWLQARGNELGMRPAQVRRLQRRLARAGVLVDLPVAAATGPDDQYWRLAHVAGAKRPRDRSRAVVEICRADPIGLRTGLLLAQAGVGAIVVNDPGPVLATDVVAGPYRGDDVGEPRQRAALGLLRAVAPHLRTSVPTGTSPDVLLLVDHHVVDPVPVRRLRRERRPHLSVLATEVAVRVGPMVTPGGACTTCLEHYRREKDDRWPAVAAQAALRPPAAVETSLVWWGAVAASQQLLAQVDGRAVATRSATLELTGWQEVPTRTSWSPHPDCECSSAHRRRARPPSRSSAAA